MAHLQFFFFFAHFYFPASGQAVVTGVVPSPPRFLPSIFISHRAQQSHCPSIFHRVLLTHALALSASQFVHKKKSPRIYTSMHCGRFELTKLTYTRLEDKLIRHRDDIYRCLCLLQFHLYEGLPCPLALPPQTCTKKTWHGTLRADSFEPTPYIARVIYVVRSVQCPPSCPSLPPPPLPPQCGRCPRGRPSGHVRTLRSTSSGRLLRRRGWRG